MYVYSYSHLGNILDDIQSGAAYSAFGRKQFIGNFKKTCLLFANKNAQCELNYFSRFVLAFMTLFFGTLSPLKLNILVHRGMLL